MVACDRNGPERPELPVAFNSFGRLSRTRVTTPTAHDGQMGQLGRVLLRAIPWILVMAGLALAVAAGINGVRGAVSGLQPAAQWQSPGTEKMYLAAGDWVVFEQATARRGPTARLEPTVGWRQLTVIGPDGEVPVTCAYCSGSETMTLGTTQYVGLVRFTADVEGEYAVTTETPGATLSVSPSVLRTVGLTFATIAWVGLGLLIFFVGAFWLLVLLIVHLLRPATQGTANLGSEHVPRH